MAHVAMHGPLGPITLFEQDGILVAIEWGWSPADGRAAVLDAAKAQLEAYFDGEIPAFDLPLAPAATAFQQRVRTAMRAIPHGQTATYAQIAHALGSAPRAIGQACARNPLPIIVPCHRVLSADGGLGGYSGGAGLETKRALLRLEGCPFADSGGTGR